MAEYRTTIDIDADPEVVYEHLVTVDGWLAWMGHRAQLDPTPGGVFAVDVNRSRIRGRYLELDPPRRVVVSWGFAGEAGLPPGSSRVEFELTRTRTGTRLDLVHSGLPDTERPRHAEGWRHFLGRLRTIPDHVGGPA